MAEPATPPERPKRRATGCLIGGLALVALSGSCFFWTLLQPRRSANALKELLHPGMSLSEVVLATFDTPSHLVFVKAEKGAPELHVVGSVVTLEGERAVGAEAARNLLERQARALRVSSLNVMFLASVPVTSSIVVRFGPDGRVTTVEGPYDRAD